MEIDIGLKLQRDSANSNPGKLELRTIGRTEIKLTLTDPDRVVIVKSDELKKAIAILVDQ